MSDIFTGLDVLSSILEEAHGKQGKVISSHGAYIKIAYGEQLHQFEKMSARDIINEQNEPVSVENGQTGLLEFRDGALKFVVASTGITSLNEDTQAISDISDFFTSTSRKVHLNEKSLEDLEADKASAKAKWHYARAGTVKNASLSKGIANDYKAQLMKRGVIDHDGKQTPLKPKTDPFKQQPLNHTKVLNVGHDDQNVKTGFHREEVEQIDEDMYDGNQKHLMKYLRLKNVSYGKYKNASSHEKKGYHAEISDLVKKGLLKEDDELNEAEIIMEIAGNRANDLIKHAKAGTVPAPKYDEYGYIKQESATPHVGSFVEKYATALQSIDEQAFYDECRMAVMVEQSSKGQDSWRSRACMAESTRRGSDIFEAAKKTVGSV